MISWLEGGHNVIVVCMIATNSLWIEFEITTVLSVLQCIDPSLLSSTAHQIQCQLNNYSFGSNSTIYIREDCQSSFVECSMPQSDNIVSFGPEDPKQKLVAWRAYGNTPHRVVIMRLKDLLSESQTEVEVRMNAVTSQETDLPSPFTFKVINQTAGCLLYTSPSPRDATLSRMPSSA